MINSAAVAQAFNKYGPFADMVTTVGAIMATTLAIWLAFKGRARWEPSEEDIPNSWQRVGGAIAGVLIVIIWSTSTSTDQSFLIKLALYLISATLLFLLLYGYLIGALTYDRIIATTRKKTKTIKIIGGFNLTENARKLMNANNITVQELIIQSGQPPNSVWTQSSRALAKLCFGLAYLGLVVCGTTALAVAAIIVNFRIQ